MSKVSIIYWSNGGNVEKLANSIAEGVKMSNVEVDIKHVNDSSVDLGSTLANKVNQSC